MWSNMYSSGPKCFQDVLQCSGPTCTPVVQNAFKMYYSAEVQHVLQWSKMLSRCNTVQWSNMYPSDPKCFQDVLRFSGPRCTTVQWFKMYYIAVVQDVLHCKLYESLLYQGTIRVLKDEYKLYDRILHTNLDRGL